MLTFTKRVSHSQKSIKDTSTFQMFQTYIVPLTPKTLKNKVSY
ncbi:hypothetical protein bthur0001_56950 [Bacillus thuringiensis serovar tochigiensis BGSC 4Y1]|nr:hypothetical protein bthur0001_56950 [Bacillus thuringiensis serovar tochigiensis BGSC 4Y1]